MTSDERNDDRAVLLARWRAAMRAAPEQRSSATPPAPLASEPPPAPSAARAGPVPRSMLVPRSSRAEAVSAEASVAAPRSVAAPHASHTEPPSLAAPRPPVGADTIATSFQEFEAELASFVSQPTVAILSRLLAAPGAAVLAEPSAENAAKLLETLDLVEDVLDATLVSGAEPEGKTEAGAPA